MEKTILPYKQSNAKKSWKVNHRSHRMNIGSLAIFFDLIQLQVLYYTTAFDPELLRPFQLHLFWNTQCSKIGKKCNFKSTKTHFLLSQKWQKNNFCTRKNFKTIKNAIFGLYSGAKIDFLPFLKMQIMLFCTFEIALFF